MRVNDDTWGAYQHQPAIAVDATGNAYAVWTDGRNPTYYGDIYFAYRPVGGSWGANAMVNDDAGTAPQSLPAIAVDGASNAYAVWADARNRPYADIYFSYRLAGGSWGANVRVNDDPTDAYQREAAIAVDGTGNAYAVWQDARNHERDYDIYFSYRPAVGAWGSNKRVNDDVWTAYRYDQYTPAIAVDGAGNAYAVWQDDRNGWSADIYFSYRPAGGSWSANVKVNDDTVMAPQERPAIAVDGAGNAYAVWQDARNDNWDIYFAHRPAGGSWGANAKVNDDTGTAYQGDPAIAVDASGNAYAVWTDTRNGNYDIYFSYRPAGGSWGANVRVNDDTGTASQYEPAIAVDASGNAYAVWTDGTGNGDIYFSYRPAAPTGKPPVVLVHGWRGTRPCNEAYDPADTFGPVGRALTEAGFHVEYARLQTCWDNTPRFEANIAPLREAINRAITATGRTTVTLIAHSMGGLVSRAYIEGPNYRGDVSSLFTFGSPHQGVRLLDVLVSETRESISLAAFCARQPGFCDMSEGNMQIFNNNDYPRRRDRVNYHLISGNAPWSWKRWRMLMWPFRPNDGLVSTGSGTSLSGVADSFRTDEFHSEDFGSYTYFSRRNGSLSRSYTECLAPVLVTGTSSTCGTVSSQALAPAAQVTPSLTARTPLEHGTLLPGQTATRTVSLPGGPALFASAWATGTITTTLRTPTGVLIDPSYAVSYPLTVSYQAEATLATYYFTSTAAGSWKLVLQAGSVPTQGTAYTTFAAFDSDVVLTAWADRFWYAPGASASITAALTGAPTSAVVTATILRADGVTDTLSLSPIGGGQYQATYAVPAASGYTEARIAATGTTSGGAPFERGQSLAFQITPNSIALSGVYSDTPQPRSPTSSLYTALTVTVGAVAAVSGTFGLSADLVATDSVTVAHSLTSRGIVTGTASLALRFDGGDIYRSKRDGPYTLTNLLLTDQRGATLVVTQTLNVYTTAAYDHRLFASFRHFIPIAYKAHPGGW